MSLTLAEITEHQNRLRREIMERECLLAAFNVLHGYAAKGHNPTTLDLASLVSTLPSTPGAALGLVASTAPAEPSALPAPPPPPPRYVHPELKAIGRGWGNHGLIVQWAIGRLESDYTLHDIRDLLAREGHPLGGSEISVVLTRLKRRGEIEEIQRGSGPNPAVFRKERGSSLVLPAAENEEPADAPSPLIAAAA